VLSQKTEESLMANGWNPDHEYDMAVARAFLEKEGLENHLHKAAIDFLHKYGGLIVNIKSEVDGSMYEACRFVVEKTSFWVDDIVDYGIALNTVLCPVGSASTNHLVVTVAEDGRVFGYFSPYIVLLGNDADEAVNNLCLREKSLKKGIYEKNGIRFEE
jgi:hypothetical protein